MRWNELNSWIPCERSTLWCSHNELTRRGRQESNKQTAFISGLSVGHALTRLPCTPSPTQQIKLLPSVKINRIDLSSEFPVGIAVLRFYCFAARTTYVITNIEVFIFYVANIFWDLVFMIPSLFNSINREETQSLRSKFHISIPLLSAFTGQLRVLHDIGRSVASRTAADTKVSWIKSACLTTFFIQVLP